MAKNLKLNIKNVQIAQALKLGGSKGKPKEEVEGEEEKPAKKAPAATKGAATKAKRTTKKPAAEAVEAAPLEETPRVRARSKSAFEEPHSPAADHRAPDAPATVEEESLVSEETDVETIVETVEEEPVLEEAPQEVLEAAPEEPVVEEEVAPPATHTAEPIAAEVVEATPAPAREVEKAAPIAPRASPAARLGPTGRHIRDILPPPKPRAPERPAPARAPAPGTPRAGAEAEQKAHARAPKAKPVDATDAASLEEEISRSKKGLKPKFKEFKDVKPLRRKEERSFDGRDRQGLRDSDDDSQWRKRRAVKGRQIIEDTTIRPTSLQVRIPIRVKDLAAEMKLKASQLVAKLFLSGMVVTLNDILEDETTIQLLGQEFGCDIQIDTSEEERIRITDKTVKEEIQAAKGNTPDKLVLRPPVVAFMGHVDHGKTSLIDAIRASNRAAGEAGAITQHIGAFRCSTPVGDITILDTPGHEAFSAMRARGADVTDIVVLVVAGDEGIRQQTLEAIQHAKAAGVTIVVAINKSDKPNFNPETVYRQLAEQELLPETWGGATITVNCSAVTKEGINTLLEMLALQAEVLELNADPTARARGSVLESEMHKGLGAVSTILVRNGTLRYGDALVFGQTWGRVKTMRNEYGASLTEAGPSTPVEITGLSGLPEAGEEFIVVRDEKEARLIAEKRREELRERALQKAGRGTLETLLKDAGASEKKILNIVLRADVQGSLEALRVALEKIESEKAELNIVFAGVGEVTESDVQLAAASKAMILGFHTQIESHAETLVKQFGVTCKLHDIIYHAIDDVKDIMTGLLDKIAEETEKGKALVKATFKSSHLGRIAGCEVIDGTIHRSNQIRVMRDGKEIWKGSISSLKRVKDDVREVAKGLECGIVLNGFSEYQEGDILEAYEITYRSQEL